MRNLLALLGLLLVIVVVVGYYRGWFTVTVDSDKNFTIKGDGSKMIRETKEGVSIGIDKVKELSENLKRDEDTKPAEANEAKPVNK